MAEVVLFHHALGLTPGIISFADELRRAGHTVHTPDLYEDRTFDSLGEGLRYAQRIGFGEIIERVVRAVEALPAELVYAGFSLGVLPAQKLAQTRPGARGALLFYSCVPVSEFGSAWPEGVPVQVHGMDADPDLRRRGRHRSCAGATGGGGRTSVIVAGLPMRIEALAVPGRADPISARRDRPMR